MRRLAGHDKAPPFVLPTRVSHLGSSTASSLEIPDTRDRLCRVQVQGTIDFASNTTPLTTPRSVGFRPASLPFPLAP